MEENKKAVLDKYHPKESFKSSYINNDTVPYPYTKFGKSIDDSLIEKGFNVKKKRLITRKNYGVLAREYIDNKNNVKIEYVHAVNFSEDCFQNNKVPEKNLKMKAQKFYDLFTNDESDSEFISIDYGESHFVLHKHNGQLVRIGLAEVEEKNFEKFLLKSTRSKKPMGCVYITQENALKYFADIVTILTKD